jgi:hypothetical protein
MPISRYNEDGTVDIYNTKTGEVREGIAPEELGSVHPNLVAEYQKNQSPESMLARKQAESELAKLESGTIDQEPLSAEGATKLSMAETGANAAREAMKQLFGEDMEGRTTFGGNIALLGATTDLVPGDWADFTPWGRSLEQNLFDAVEAILRARSGAAVPEEEVRRYLKGKGPRLTDPAHVKRQKLKSIEDELLGTISAMGREPRFNQDRFTIEEIQ